MGASSGGRGRRTGAACASACLLGAALTSLAVSGAPAAQGPALCPPSAPAPATPPSVPPSVLACVGAQEITLASYEHWSEVANAAGGAHPPSAHEVTQQVMNFLISADWVRGEARARHVHVSRAAVRRKFDQLRKQQFPKLRQFRAFLRESKETVADLLMRTELQLLASGIQRRVTAGKRGPRARAKALGHFVEHFRQKWQAQTYCAKAYAVADCGHVQEAL